MRTISCRLSRSSDFDAECFSKARRHALTVTPVSDDIVEPPANTAAENRVGVNLLEILKVVERDRLFAGFASNGGHKLCVGVELNGNEVACLIVNSDPMAFGRGLNKPTGIRERKRFEQHSAGIDPAERESSTGGENVWYAGTKENFLQLFEKPRIHLMDGVNVVEDGKDARTLRGGPARCCEAVADEWAG